MDGDFNFNIVIVVVFLLIGAVRWVLENFSRNKNSGERDTWGESEYEQRADQAAQPSSLEDLYEEARREILDRQNRHVPQPEVIEEKLRDYRPAPARQAPQTPPSAPPPIPGKARINKAPAAVPEAPKPFALPEVRRPNLSPAEQQAIVNFQEVSSNKGKRKSKSSPTGSKVRELLASPTAARDAIVLTEILGPPKGMQ